MEFSPSARRRWLLAPALAAAFLVLAALVPRLGSASAEPDLPELTPQQLIEKVGAARVDALSGTLRLSTNLGLPDLGGVAPQDGGSSALSLLSGDHTARVWFDGPERARMALPDWMEETDVVRNGDDLWVWRSHTQTATHVDLSGHHGEGSDALDRSPGHTVPTPAAVAHDVLAAVAPSTAVSVHDPAYVAGRPAYELVVEPRSTDSLVGKVVMAVDAATGLPLRVQVVSRSGGSPAVDLGFTAVSFSRPDADNFRFTPPPGAHVEQRSGRDAPDDGPRPGVDGPPPAGADHPQGTGHDGRQVVGEGWDAVAVLDGADLSDPRAAGLVQQGRSVSGPWGSGRLLTSTLVDALVLDSGRVLVGAVTPERLEAVAAGLR